MFVGCGAIAVDSQTGALGHVGVALAFGLVIAVMIYALGPISGGHFNPAVSVAIAVGRHFPRRSIPTYVAAQVAGATVAALVLRATLVSAADLGVTRPSGADLQAFAREVTLTFSLVLVVTAVATDARAVGEAAAITIGGTVALCALVGGPINDRTNDAVLASVAYRYLRGPALPV